MANALQAIHLLFWFNHGNAVLFLNISCLFILLLFCLVYVKVILIGTFLLVSLHNAAWVRFLIAVYMFMIYSDYFSSTDDL